MPICRFRTLGYTSKDFLAVRIFHPGYSLSVWGVDAENPGNSKTLGQQGGRWRCHVAWMQKDGDWAPINCCGTHPQWDANWHMPLTPVVLNRRVLEKKIYRIFCFLDEDMDSHSLKEQMFDISCFQICLCNANESTLIFWWWVCFCSHNSELWICLLRVSLVCYAATPRLYLEISSSLMSRQVVWPGPHRQDDAWCPMRCDASYDVL